MTIQLVYFTRAMTNYFRRKVYPNKNILAENLNFQKSCPIAAFSLSLTLFPTQLASRLWSCSEQSFCILLNCVYIVATAGYRASSHIYIAATAQVELTRRERQRKVDIT